MSMKRARPGTDDETLQSPQEKRARERSSSTFPLRLSGILFKGEATDHDVDGNLPVEVGEYVPTSPASIDLPVRLRWTKEFDAYIYRLAKPFTFRYRRSTIDNWDAFPEDPEWRAVFWDWEGDSQSPKFFLHPAVPENRNDMDNTWPYEAWLLPDIQDSEMDHDRVRHYKPPFKLFTCDEVAEVLVPTRASRYAMVEIHENTVDDRFYLRLEGPIPAGTRTHVIWDNKELWGIRVGLSPVLGSPNDFVDYEYEVQATIDEVYVKEEFFDFPPKNVSRIEKEVVAYKRWLLNPDQVEDSE